MGKNCMNFLKDSMLAIIDPYIKLNVMVITPFGIWSHGSRQLGKEHVYWQYILLMPILNVDLPSKRGGAPTAKKHTLIF